MREFEFELTFFGGDRQLVQVVGRSRAHGFAGAPLKAADPNNVWKVRVVRDSGLYLVSEFGKHRKKWDDPHPHIPVFVVPATESVVPNGEFSPTGYSAGDHVRTYHMDWVFFNGALDMEMPDVSGRPNAFAACAMDTQYPDSVMEVSITSVCERDYNNTPHEVDVGKEYGGVTLDLKDPFVPLRLSE